MLYLYDARIFYNIELGRLHRPYYATSIPFCDNDKVKEMFPNVTLFETVTQKDIANGKYQTASFLISPGQYRGFIRDYVSHSNTNKLYNWDADSFYMEYFNMMKDVAKLGSDHGYHGKWLEDDGVYDTLATEELIDMEVPSVEDSPIIINSDCKPELSLRIEDALYAMINGTSSLYTNEVNNLVKSNITKLGFIKDMHKKMYGIDIFSDIDTTIEADITKINYTNPHAMIYFYYYSFLPGVRTNVYHLKRVLEAMKKRG